MTTTEETDAANTARGQLAAFVEKLRVLVREGDELLLDMDARADSTETTEEE